MLRLRTTSTLSLLALGIGIAGTQWFSDQTGSSAEPLASHATHHATAHHVAVQHVAHRAHVPSKHPMIDVRSHYAVVPATLPVTPVASRSNDIQWVPISMPVSSIPFARMRHHDVGNLVLHLVVDGQGEVTQATLAQSSGDAVLDANALVMARQWRFAVPLDHPYGFSGDLPLRFSASSA
jgi:periplasmic protein TonB